MAALLLLLRPFLPYILGGLLTFGGGFGSAWYLQGLRITAVQQELVQVKLDAQKATQDAKDKADKITKETQNATVLSIKAVADYYSKHPVVRVLPAAKRSAAAVPSDTGNTGPRPADDVPADTPQRIDSALGDCAVTTVMFVQLRDWAREQRRQSLGD